MSIASLPEHSNFQRIPHRPNDNRLTRYCNVIYALMMHDIKNRFFGSGLGQIAMVIWPFAHVVVIMVIYIITKRPNPYGESLIQYTVVSLFPFICFNYVSRWIVFAAQTNRSFLQYPIIRPLDLLVGRALLEIVSISMVAIMLILMVIICGYNAIPQDPVQALYAFGACIFMAVSMGILNGVIAFVIPMWNLVYTVVILISYVSSGILFVAANLPEQIRTPLSYNPLLVCTEWIRSAYFSDYPTLLLDRVYVLKFSLITLTLGLILERVLRRLF